MKDSFAIINCYFQSQGEKPAPMMISGIFPGSRKAIVVGVMGKPKIEDQTGK